MGFLDARYIKRRASWPVWSDSTTTPIRFQPMPKKAAGRLWHRARTSIARRASLVATAVLHALGLLNFATGRLGAEGWGFDLGLVRTEQKHGGAPVLGADHLEPAADPRSPLAHADKAVTSERS